MDTYWMEQSGGDVPSMDAWLHPDEAVRLSGIRFPKRRADWRLGRWTAKLAVSRYLVRATDPEALAAIEIRASASGAPQAFLDDCCAPVTISISHRSGKAACAIAPAGIALGCDLELIESRSAAFVSDYFTAEEQQWVARSCGTDRLRLVPLVWSAKECALKALGEGLRIDTRCVRVNLEDDVSEAGAWHSLSVHYTGGRDFHGWWQDSMDLLCVVVADPASNPPIRFAPEG